MRVRPARRLICRCIVSARGGGDHKGFERGKYFLYHGMGFSEEVQYGMEVHKGHGSSVPRHGRKRVDQRGLRRVVQADQ